MPTVRKRWCPQGSAASPAGGSRLSSSKYPTSSSGFLLWHRMSWRRLRTKWCSSGASQRANASSPYLDVVQLGDAAQTAGRPGFPGNEPQRHRGLSRPDHRNRESNLYIPQKTRTDRAARRKTDPAFQDVSIARNRCKRNIEMTPPCKVEVTLPRVVGSGEVHRGGGVVDEQAGVQPS